MRLQITRIRDDINTEHNVPAGGARGLSGQAPDFAMVYASSNSSGAFFITICIDNTAWTSINTTV